MTSMGSLFQCLTTPSVKKLIHIFCVSQGPSPSSHTLLRDPLCGPDIHARWGRGRRHLLALAPRAAPRPQRHRRPELRWIWNWPVLCQTTRKGFLSVLTAGGGKHWAKTWRWWTGTTLFYSVLVFLLPTDWREEWTINLLKILCCILNMVFIKCLNKSNHARWYQAYCNIHQIEKCEAIH